MLQGRKSCTPIELFRRSGDARSKHGYFLSFRAALPLYIVLVSRDYKQLVALLVGRNGDYISSLPFPPFAPLSAHFDVPLTLMVAILGSL